MGSRRVVQVLSTPITHLTVKPEGFHSHISTVSGNLMALFTPNDKRMLRRYGRISLRTCLTLLNLYKEEL